MSIKTFSNSDFQLVNGLYISSGVCIEKDGAAVQVVTTAEATVTVQRAVNAKDFTPIADFSTKINGVGEFSVSGCLPGQWLRIASTLAPVSCNILT